jgi:UDP-N-acetylmuramoyl-L-alanyl-D-glutamate--2,6-diaminopimelate ligase
MQLRDILKDCNVKNIIGDYSIDVSSVEFDSRNVKEGSLFVCLKGYTVNGHNFIDKAIDNGAKVIVIEDDVEIREGYTYVKVYSTRKDMAKIASNFYNNPSSRFGVIGVTGTNGKTSITTFLREVLSLNSNKSGLVGTISINNGAEDIVSKNTTPESMDLQKYFNEMIDNGCDYCAMEVSSHSLCLGRVDETKFNIGVFTNLTPDHLDFHKDLDDYRNAKEMLFYQTTDRNIINTDDEGGKAIYENIQMIDTPIYTYGIDNKADFMAKDIKITPLGTSYTLVTPSYESDIFVPVPGKFTVYNTLAVIATCYTLGIDIDVIKNALKQTEGVSGRFETVPNDKEIHVIVDYAHTPDALENVINTARGFAEGRIITVFGCGGDRDKTKRPVMANIASSLSDIVVVTSDNPRTEDPNQILNDVVSGIVEDKKESAIICIDRREAINKAINLAKKDDIVLIAGKGHEDYQIIGREKIHFDDKEEALKALSNK